MHPFKSSLCRRLMFSGLALSGLTLSLAGCNTAPKTEEARVELTNDTAKTLARMERDDPGLANFLNNAYAYVLFPDVGAGALGVGGAHGHGEAYQNGQLAGYAELTLVDIGLQAGGQEYAELIVFRGKGAFDKFTNNNLTFEAGASAVALKSGAAAEAKWHDDIVVFKVPKAGLMFQAAVGGQRFTYKATATAPPPANSPAQPTDSPAQPTPLPPAPSGT